MKSKFNQPKVIKIFQFSLISCVSLTNVFFLGNKSFASEKKNAASNSDIALYSQMGASYACIASRAEVDFKKAVGIATYTFVNVMNGKHDGHVKHFGDQKLGNQQLMNMGSLEIVSRAMQICSDNVPKEIKEDFNKQVKEIEKSKKKSRKK